MHFTDWSGSDCQLTSFDNRFIKWCNSMMPLSPINLLTLNSRVVMPPCGVFTAPDIYYWKHWRRVQCISNEFWSRWRIEVLAIFRCQQKWNIIRNCKVGDIALLKKEAAERNIWPMAKIVAINTDENGFVRSVKLMRGTSGTTDMVLRYLERPVSKLEVLVENEWVRYMFEFHSTTRSLLWMIEKFWYMF